MEKVKKPFCTKEQLSELMFSAGFLIFMSTIGIPSYNYLTAQYKMYQIKQKQERALKRAYQHEAALSEVSYLKERIHSLEKILNNK